MKKGKPFILIIFFLLFMGNCSVDPNEESKKNIMAELLKNAKKHQHVMDILQKELEKEYPNEKIGIGIMNDDYLKVHFINSSLKNLSKEEKKKMAVEVGKLVKKYLPSTTRITEGKLMFTVSKNYIVYRYYNELDYYDLKLHSESHMIKEQKRIISKDINQSKISKQKSIDELIEDLYGPKSVRQQAITALLKRGNSSVDHLIKLIDEGNEDVRCSVIYILGEMQLKKVEKYLIKALNDPSLCVQVEATEALGNMKSNKAIVPLILVLKESGEPLLRSRITFALAKIGESAIEPVAELLQSKDRLIRIYAVRTFEKMDSFKKVERLIKALNDEDEVVCDIALKALKKIKTREAENAVKTFEKKEN